MGGESESNYKSVRITHEEDPFSLKSWRDVQYVRGKVVYDHVNLVVSAQRLRPALKDGLQQPREFFDTGPSRYRRQTNVHSWYVRKADGGRPSFIRGLIRARLR